MVHCVRHLHLELFFKISFRSLIAVTLPCEHGFLVNVRVDHVCGGLRQNRGFTTVVGRTVTCEIGDSLRSWAKCKRVIDSVRGPSRHLKIAVALVGCDLSGTKEVRSKLRPFGRCRILASSARFLIENSCQAPVPGVSRSRESTVAKAHQK